MPAREYLCKVLQTQWLTPTVVELRFEPSRSFRFDPGQFVSVMVPNPDGSPKPLRRAYSLSVPYELGWGLCVKIVPEGPGSNYMASLKVGDYFKVSAPYGHFLYDSESGRDACFISTGTGVAPFLAMIHSEAYRDNMPERATSIFGARTENEIIYPGYFERLGLTEINAVSQPEAGYSGFKGRVTDYLRNLPADWAWDHTDFYICGNGQMVSEVRKLLRGRGVPEEHIHKEVYFTSSAPVAIPGARVVDPLKKTG